ncbi:hypothetical protein [Paenibacillus sp. FSL M7-0896]
MGEVGGDDWQELDGFCTLAGGCLGHGATTIGLTTLNYRNSSKAFKS